MSDLIKREDAIKALDNWCYKDDIEAEIRAIPSIEPKRGEWIHYINDYGIKETRCSACDVTFTTGDGYGWNYCPWCGADMREVRDE